MKKEKDKEYRMSAREWSMGTEGRNEVKGLQGFEEEELA